MAMLYATITGRIVIPGTTTGIPGELRATPRTANGVLTFPAEDYTTVGYARADVTADGTLSPSLKIPTAVPDGTLWRLQFHPKGKGNLPVLFGDYEITASADVADLVPIDPIGLTPTIAEQLAERIEALEAGEGSGGGSGSLLVVSGGTVALDNTAANGYLVGYRVTATTTIEGKAFAAGSYIFERDTSVASGWTYRMIDDGLAITTGPVDSTAPTAGTLASSAVTSTGFTLTVSGAADGTALHASPYSFSTDSGTTWTAYQSSAVYTATGLTTGVAYQARHRTRDAAGNVSLGTAITVTPAAESITDTFTGSDAASINGRTTTTGGKTWTTPWSVGTGLTGTAALASNRSSGGSARVATDAQNYEVSCAFDITAGGSSTVRVFARGQDNADAAEGAVSVRVANGDTNVQILGSGSWHATNPASGTTGTLLLRVVGTTGTIFVNGSQVGSPFTFPAGCTGPNAGFTAMAGGIADTFKVEYL